MMDVWQATARHMTWSKAPLSVSQKQKHDTSLLSLVFSYRTDSLKDNWSDRHPADISPLTPTMQKKNQGENRSK